MTIDQIKELAGHRDVSPWVIKLVQDAVEIEREACAKVCEAEAKGFEQAHLWDEEYAVKNCAAAIRARGEK